MSSFTKGEIAARLFDIKCLILGYSVSVPITEIRYDRIVDIQNKLYRVQVKYCDRKCGKSKNVYNLCLKTHRNKKVTNKCYTTDEIDALVVYLPSKERFYWFPPEVFNNKKSLTLRVSPPLKNYPYLNINEYEFGVLA
jgi:hypothetical protein